MAEVLKIDSSQIIWVQVLCQFFHLKEKIIKMHIDIGEPPFVPLVCNFHKLQQLQCLLESLKPLCKQKSGLTIG